MKIKKIFSVVLVGVLGVSLFASCGTKKDGDSSNGEYSNKQIVIGDETETSGDFTPYWTNNASDYAVYKMVTGLSPIEINKAGEIIVNETVVDNFDEKSNDDGSKTYTVKIKKGLTFSDGSEVKAENYVFSYVFFTSNVFSSDLEAVNASATSARYLVGFNEYINGETNVFKGVHLVDDYTFSVTMDSKYLPYYYGKSVAGVSPEYLGNWVPEDVVVEETEDGAKLSDNFTKEYVGETVEDGRYNSKVFSGAYVIEKYDKSGYAYTLKRNENFPGNYEGQKANIETVIYKYVASDTKLNQLKSGDIDLLPGALDGKDIDAGLDLVDQGGFKYISYPRNGYGMLTFKCNQGPTQFKEVRQAVAYLLDRNEFTKTFTLGHGTVVNGPYGLSQWMVEDNEETVNNLNAYSYSLDKANELLTEGGWVYNEDGSDYTGSGVRYKKLEDGTYMPLVIEWFSSDNNPVSDLLVTSLQNNPDVEKAGIKINRTTGTFNELITNYYDNSEENKYQMFNLANGFGTPYDVAYAYEPGSDSNTNAIDDQKLYDLAVAMNQVDEGDDEAYSKAWAEFMTYWNELMPEIPLYSNTIHDFMSDKVFDFNSNGADFDTSAAILYTNIK